MFCFVFQMRVFFPSILCGLVSLGMLQRKERRTGKYFSKGKWEHAKWVMKDTIRSFGEDLICLKLIMHPRENFQSLRELLLYLRFATEKTCNFEWMNMHDSPAQGWIELFLQQTRNHSIKRFLLKVHWFNPSTLNSVPPKKKKKKRQAWFLKSSKIKVCSH